jgi:tRNA-Thr(GGU) m(6)t(6)A37 methyltransferase TsaA
MEIKPIGIIHSPHKQAGGTPVQSSMSAGVEGTVEVFPEYAAGLKDLEGFERVWLVYWFDRAKTAQLVVVPYLDTVPRGLFATRAPCRPNPVGISPVRLLGINGCCLRVADVDVLDETPLLDIKPYVPAFDSFSSSRPGWFSQANGTSVLADERFETGFFEAKSSSTK